MHPSPQPCPFEEKGSIVADGAMGTVLMGRVPGTERPSSLNLERPAIVRGLHAEYVAAGADLLMANTLRATPEEAAAGVRLAREAAGQGLMVAGSLAADPPPTVDLVEALGLADVLLLEAVTSLALLGPALEAIRSVSDIPVWATFSVGQDGRLDGLEASEVAARLRTEDVAAFGYGCGWGPDHARPFVAALRRAAPEAVLIAKPNLGLPVDGVYAVTPLQLADWASDMRQLGVQGVGACCGSTPDHIRAVAGRLNDR